MSKNFVSYQDALNVLTEYAEEINKSIKKFSVMPNYTNFDLGTIIQYVGANSGDYVKGYFYERTASGWVQKNTQPNASGLGTAAFLDVAESGDAGSNEVVKGNDSRLSDSRPASDVSSWAKQLTKPTYNKTEVGLGNVDNTSDSTKKTNFTGSIADGNTGFATGGDVYTALSNKVDKVEGKGLSANDYTDAASGKLNNIEAGAEVNVLEGVQVDGTDLTISNKKVNIVLSGKADKVVSATSGNLAGLDSNGNITDSGSKASDFVTPSDLGTAAVKDYTSSVTSGSTDLVESGAVKEAIDTAVASSYHHAGTKTCAELLHALLVAANEGNVYNITDDGTTTSDFIEGAGKPIREGNNVGVAKVSSGVYKFDLLSGLIDTSNFVSKSQTAGLIKNDGTIDTAQYAQDSTVIKGVQVDGTDLTKDANGKVNINNKATRPSESTAGDIATLTADGNLADGGFSFDKDGRTVSGNPLFFTTDSAQVASDCKITLEPIQDLHGQNNPYPAGGGENLLPLSLDVFKSFNTEGTWDNNVYTKNSVAFTFNQDSDGNVISIKVNGTPGSDTDLVLSPVNSSAYYTTNTNYIISGCPANGSTGTYYIQYWDTVLGGGYDTGSGYSFTYRGNNVNIRLYIKSGYNANNLIFKPMIRLATVADSTFAPYSNICSISGYDKISLVSCGFNLWDEQWELGYIDANGNPQTGSNNIRSKNFINISSDLSYFAKNDGDTMFYYYDASKSFISAQYMRTSGLLTVPQNAKYARFYNNKTTYNNNICINISKTEGSPKNGDYKAYNPVTDITHNLPETVYGGTLDVESGELVVDSIKKSNWTGRWYQSSDSRIPSGRAVFWYSYQVSKDVGLENSKPAGNDDNINNIKMYCNKSNMSLSYNQILTKNEFAIGIGGNSLVSTVCFNVSTSEASTPSEFAEWIASQSIEIVYPLATPYTIRLTPAQVNLLKGANTVTTNGTTITLKYRDGELAKLEDFSGIGESINALGEAHDELAEETKELTNELLDKVVFKDFATISNSSTVTWNPNSKNGLYEIFISFWDTMARTLATSVYLFLSIDGNNNLGIKKISDPSNLSVDITYDGTTVTFTMSGAANWKIIGRKIA